MDLGIGVTVGARIKTGPFGRAELSPVIQLKASGLAGSIFQLCV
jgi:hypothetical protein